jgi:LCP family protein required for cell wall assembly
MATSTKQSSVFDIGFVLVFKFLAFLMTLVTLWLLETTPVMATAPVVEVEPAGPQVALVLPTLITQTTSLTPTMATAGACATTGPEPIPGKQPMYLVRELLNRASFLTARFLPNPEVQERMTILLLGSDNWTNEKYGHTDTLILVTIDPEAETAAMLSIPRDLWVTIPGYGENRINQAYRLGEMKKHPGGGAALLRETITANLGIPVNFHVMVDFDGFKRIIDTLGGIDVCVQQTIDAATYNGYVPDGINPDGYYSYAMLSPEQAGANIFQKSLGFDEKEGYKFFYIQAGPHTLNGDTALLYARTRATVTADFARARRQQEVLLAIRRKALQIGIIPKLPELWSTVGEIIKTDLQLADALRLARLAYTIDLDDIRTEAIGIEQTTDHTTSSGAQVLLPDREKIKLLVDDLFGSSKPTALPTYAEQEANGVVWND